MQQTIERVTTTFFGYLPTLAAAIAVLVGGWFVARILATATRSTLRRTDLDDRLAEWVGGERGEPLKMEHTVGRAVFYLVMIFVLIGFFQILRLDLITEPLNVLLAEVSEFAPRLLGASGLLLLAWITATALRRIVSGALAAADLDVRMGKQALEHGKPLPLSKTLSDAVYWLVFLLFLPAVLDALAVDGLLGPVQSAIDQILSFVPNLISAVLILGVGWLIARFVQRIVTSLLAAVGVDSVPKRLKIEMPAGSKVSQLVGLITYVLILVPVVISALDALQLDAITTPATMMLSTIFGMIPVLFAAALLLLIAYGVGRLASGLIARVLADAGFDNLLGRLGLRGSPQADGRSLSDMAGSLTMIAILVFAAIEAANMIGFVALGGVLTDFIVFAGQVVLGLVIFAVGLWLSNLAASTVLESGVSQARLLSVAAKVSILVLAGAMALRQMGIGEEIIALAFGIVLGAVAVAAALAFGLGSREVAAEEVRRWREEARS